MTDFTNCPIVPGRAYNGANGSKIAVEYGGGIYMLKFPPSGERKPTNLSYTNSCISEHLASSIFNLIGINAQKTELGTSILYFLLSFAHIAQKILAQSSPCANCTMKRLLGQKIMKKSDYTTHYKNYTDICHHRFIHNLNNTLIILLFHRKFLFCS